MQADNLAVLAERQDCDRAEARGEMVAKAHKELFNELADALLNDPARVVRTPGFADKSMTALAVVEDDFAGTGGTESLLGMLRVLGWVAEGRTGPMVGLTANAAIAQIAARHASFHAADLADVWEDA